MEEEFFGGRGGILLFARAWRPAGQARAIIILVHGFKSHSGLYDWPAQELVADGFVVYALDLRGHGKSEGERLYVDNFADYVGDLERFIDLVRAREDGLPLFLLGHSAGGIVSCLYAVEHQELLAGLICESFAYEVATPDFALAAIKGLSRIAPRLHVLNLKDEYFARDPAFVARMKKDPLIEHAAYPARTVAEMARADEHLKRDFPLITLPVLILHGTEDRLTEPLGSQHFYDKAGSEDKTLKLYDGHLHDLLHDFGKERVMSDIKQWTDAHTPR